MKKNIDRIKIIATLLICMALAGCGGSDGSNISTSENQPEETKEDYFEWNENIIVGLSAEGKKQKKLVIPERCEGFNCILLYGEDVEVKEISFESDKDITLGDSLSYAEKLEKVELPKNLTEISELEFYSCSALKEIIIPASVDVVGAYAFQDNISLEKVVFEGNTTTIEMYAFDGCLALETLELPETLTTIKENAFYECEALESVKLPSSISEIGAMAFMNSGVTDVFFPETVELAQIDTTSFVQISHSVNVHVVKGSWMDQNFERLFDGPYVKCYE